MGAHLAEQDRAVRRPGDDRREGVADLRVGVPDVPVVGEGGIARREQVEPGGAILDGVGAAQEDGAVEHARAAGDPVLPMGRDGGFVHRGNAQS